VEPIILLNIVKETLNNMIRIVTDKYTREELMLCEHAQLHDMYVKAHELYDIINKAKDMAIDFNKIQDVIKFTTELVYLESNLKLMFEVLRDKEEALLINTGIAYVCVN
jgi:hypothetical protein